MGRDRYLVAVMALHGNYGIFMAVTVLYGACTGRLPYTSRNIHLDPVIDMKTS